MGSEYDSKSKEDLIKELIEAKTLVHEYQTLEYERKIVDERVFRQTAVFEGINKMFFKSLHCETEKELALSCISVAEEITGSEFGYIGLLNESGLFDIIAMNKAGRDACKIPQKDAQNLLRDMKIRGIDRSVIKEEKFRLINELYTHPDQSGTPEGHPAISCFLGIPLKDERKTIGMIALANKKDDYDVIDRDNIETLSAAFVEALKRKQAEETLRESEKRYRMLFENANIAIFVAQDGMIKSPNPKALDLHGYSEEDFISKPFMNFIHPEDQKMVQDRHERRLRGEGLADTYSYRIINKAGDTKWVELNVVPFLWEGKPATFCFMSEITERKQAEELLRESEEKYRTILENIEDGYYEVDIAGNFTFFNDAMCRIQGLSRDELMGVNNREYMTEETTKEVYQAFNEVYTTGKPVNNLEWVTIRKDGTKRYVETSISLIKDSEGHPIGFRGVVRDVTERKFAVEEKVRLEAQLQQAYKMESIGTLAGGIAHDFNNILSPIMVHSEMGMMKLPPDNPAQHNLNEIFKAGERARDMVMQILMFSRKEAGKRAAIKIIPILKEVLKMLRSSLPTTIDIHQNLETESDTIFANSTQIHQILLNLGTNATHAMRERGGTLKVSLVQEELDSGAAEEYSDLNPGSYMRLTMSDTGCGMDEETMQKIFDPYFTTKGPGEGTGMGLAVVHGIVKSYGGDITVESELGKGTTFHIVLPRVEAEVTPVKEHKIELPRGTERLLFVDDEKGAVDAIQPMLENLGYNVTARTSSIEALEVFRNKAYEFDLVITDMTMPNMTGKELAGELMSIRSDIPVILCTGFSEQIDEDRAKEMGIRAFVMKPIVMNEIANTIRQVLEKK